MRTSSIQRTVTTAAAITALTLAALPVDTFAQDASATAAAEVTATIVLGETTTIDGTGASVTADGVDITAGGTYQVSGTLTDGMLHVDAADAAVTLILDDATITNTDGPAIYIEAASEATLLTTAATTSTLTDGGTSEQDAALYSVPTVILGGDGTLIVHATYEGISSTVDIRMESGTVRVLAGEDGLNANEDGVSDITISGGDLYVETVAGDGIDSNGTIHISGGHIVTLGSLTDANAGIDADGEITITGGTLVATGSMMGIPGATSTQESVVVSFDTTLAADTLISIQADGIELLTFAPGIDARTLLFSSADLADGVTYDVYLGGSSSTTSVDGVYPPGGYTPGELSGTTTTELPEGGFGPGGFRGGRPGEGGPGTAP
ncbi:MAG: carbohydrate-binding domain-containing protein [Chloroflexi bacterium]|nr:carbohydrate-binding domain-containing protein [Chloroflexota bacterium]